MIRSYVQYINNRICLAFVIGMIILMYTINVEAAGNLDPNLGKAVEVELQDFDGKTTKLSENFNGGKGYILVNFWGLRCASCIEEIPFLNRLSEKYTSGRVSVIGINADGIDGKNLSVMTLRGTKLKQRYRIYADPEMKAIDLFGMKVAPLTLLVSSQGEVLFRHEGYSAEDEQKIEDSIERLTR